MTTTKQQRVIQNYPRMLQIARDMGCQLQPIPTNRAILRGLCPFHDADTLVNAKTLIVDTRSVKFHCTLCNANGDPTAFIAKAWGVSAQDAEQLIQHHQDVGATRPHYPEGHFHQDQDSPPPQNTALLTRASRFFGEQLYGNYHPLEFLARLAVTPQEAEKKGVGYCPGAGLREALTERGATAEEIEQSPLFNQNTGLETFAGNITIADRDSTGAAVWMAAVEPQPPDDNYCWKTTRPSTYGISGRKPFLFNINNIPAAGNPVTITDDSRLYIVLAANEIPTILITQRRRGNENIEPAAQRTARDLISRGYRKICVAVQDSGRASLITNGLKELAPNASVTRLNGKEAMDSGINPLTRDLSRFTDFPQTSRRRRGRETRPPRTQQPAVDTSQEENTKTETQAETQEHLSPDAELLQAAAPNGHPALDQIPQHEAPEPQGTSQSPSPQSPSN